MSEDVKTEENVEKQEVSEEVSNEGAPVSDTDASEAVPGAGQEPELSLEDSLNLLVSLARQSKLNYQEHQTVDRAISTLVEALNKNPK